MLVVRAVQPRQGLPVLLGLAGPDELWNVDLVREQLQVLHQLVELVLGVQNSQLGEDSHVRALQSEASLHEGDELLVLAPALVELADVLQVIGVHDDAQAAELSEPVLLLLHAGKADLLPGLGRVGLARGLHGGLVLLELHESAGEPSPVGQAREDDLGRLEDSLVEAAITDRLEVDARGSNDELLQLSQLSDLGVRVRKLGVHGGLHDLGPHHLEVLDEVLVRVAVLGCGNDVIALGLVIGTDVRVDGILDASRGELGLGKLAPALLLLDLGGVLVRPLDRLEVLQKDLHGGDVEVELLVDEEGLLEELGAHRNLSNGRAIEVVEPVDVVHHPGSVRLDGGQNQQVLQVGVATEGRVLEHNLLQQLDQLVWQVGGHEGLDADRDLLWVLALREGSGHDLVDELPAVLALRVQNLGPKIGVHPLHDVPRLDLEHGVLVGAVHESIIALPALVGHAGKVWIPLLTVLSDNRAVVVGVGCQEVLRVVVRVDDDLSQGIVNMSIRASLADKVVEEGGEELHLVALLDLRDERLDGKQGADAQDEVGDELLVALHVQESSDNLGGLGGIDLLDVSLDVLEHVVLEKVEGKVPDEVKPVANIDERPGVLELGLHEELLGLLRVVEVALPGDPLHLLDLAGLGGGLNVLEVHIRVLGEGKVRPEVEVQALVGLEGLKELNDSRRSDLLGVLLSNLDDQLQVLLHVDGQHLLEAGEGPLWGQGAEELHQSLGLDCMSVDDDALDVREVAVVLQGPHVQARLLAELGDPWAVVVREHVVRENRIRDVGVGHQVDLQDLGLEHGLLWQVRLEHLQQEGRGLADHVPLQEEVGDGVHVHWWSWLLGDGHRQLGGGLRVAHQQGLHDVHVVRLVANLAAVLDELLELSPLGKGSHNLLGGVGLEVDLEGKVGVSGGLDKVSQGLVALELVLVHPVLQKLLLVLGQDEPSQLQALQRVELALGEEGAKVLEERGGLARLDLDPLELLNGLLGAQGTHRRLGRSDGGLLVLPERKEALKVLAHQGLGAGEVAPLGDGQGKVQVVQRLAHEGHHALLVHGGQEHLSPPVDGVEPSDSCGLAGQEDWVRGDPGPVHGGGRLQVVHEQQSELGDDVNQPVLLADLHGHRKVVRKLWREEELRLLLGEGGLPSGGRPELDHVELGDQLAVHHRLLGETDQGAGLRVCANLDGGKGRGVGLEGLAPRLRRRVELHVALDELGPVGGPGGDPDQDGPLLVWGHHVLDDLRAVQVGGPVKDLDGRGRAVHVPVVHGGGRHDSDLGWGDPLPEHDLLGHLVAPHLGLGVQVENLQVVGGLSRHGGLERDDLAVRVHQRRVRGDRPPHGLHGLLHVDDHDVVRAARSRPHLANANVLLALHGEVGEGDVLLVDAQAGQQQTLLHADRRGVGRHGC
mmetsp:Transcript_10474/g.36145  ORF Transcript_10474/g.36145 Transcript_10474/m.36145 type:complete len:1393 (-) Transcript_10474:82-4260(-)